MALPDEVKLTWRHVTSLDFDASKVTIGYRDYGKKGTCVGTTSITGPQLELKDLQCDIAFNASPDLIQFTRFKRTNDCLDIEQVDDVSQSPDPYSVLFERTASACDAPPGGTKP